MMISRRTSLILYLLKHLLSCTGFGLMTDGAEKAGLERDLKEKAEEIRSIENFVKVRVVATSVYLPSYGISRKLARRRVCAEGT